MNSIYSAAEGTRLPNYYIKEKPNLMPIMAPRIPQQPTNQYVFKQQLLYLK